MLTPSARRGTFLGMIGRIGCVVLLALLSLSCRPPQRGAERSEPVPPPAAEVPAEETLAEDTLAVTVLFVQGNATVLPAGTQAWIPLEPGMTVQVSDLIRTAADASAELAFGTIAVVRLLPGTEASPAALRVRRETARAAEAVELSLHGGALLSKVRTLSGRDEFVVTTPNSAAGVRGTEFLVRYEAELPGVDGGPGRGPLSRVAVREGAVAVLPKGPLLTGLLDGRDANPLAAAVVSAAFALAPLVRSGGEAEVGGSAAAQTSAEEAYGALVYAAEGLQAAGLDLEAMDAEAQTSALAGPGSDLARRMEELRRRFPASPVGEENRILLDLLDRVRSPGESASRLPAALPQEFLSRPAASSGAAGRGGGTRTAAPAYPAVAWNVAVSARPLSGSIARVGSLILVLDGDGAVHALDGSGRTVWTAGGGVLNLTALDSTVALIRETGLVLVDGADGSLRAEHAFDGWAALPQNKAVPVPEGLAMATPRGVMIVRQENAQVLREIPVAGGIASPLVLADRTLVGVSGTGALVLIDLTAGRPAAELAAGLGRRPFAPRYRNGAVYAADASGRIVAADVSAAALLWTRDLGAGIRGELELDDRTLFVWTDGDRLRRLSPADGADAGPPIADVESAPLLSQGKLYWGGPGSTLVTADAATGAVLSSVALPDTPSVRPLMIDGVLYVGTSKGRLLRVR